MRYVEEFRDRDRVLHCAEAVREAATRPWTLMEVCGGQTHAIVKHGLDTLLDGAVELIHGPGCPVCVTPAEMLDTAHEIAAQPGVVFCTFADMLRVPGTRTDFYEVKAAGGDVRIVQTPLEALRVAEAHPDREIVFFAVGFETTAPACAMSVFQAKRRGLSNYAVLVSHVLVPPAMEAVLQAPGNRVQGFLAAGHVCTVMGWEEYVPIARDHRVPIVVTGFEPLDVLQGALLCVRQLEAGRHEVENQYARAVQREGNRPAQALIREVFAVADRAWRGIGPIGASGLALRPAYRRFDALARFGAAAPASHDAGACISGEILQGLRKPGDCPSFGTACTPEHPLGATMVSSEGACAAYHRYRAPTA